MPFSRDQFPQIAALAWAESVFLAASHATCMINLAVILLLSMKEIANLNASGATSAVVLPGWFISDLADTTTCGGREWQCPTPFHGLAPVRGLLPFALIVTQRCVWQALLPA